MSEQKTMSTRTKTIIGGAAVAVVAAGGLGVMTLNDDSGKAADVALASEAAPQNVRQTNHLTVAAATKAAQTVLDAATKENQKVTVAVVDRDGNLLVLLRGDGAGPQSPDSAKEKAFTAVAWNAPTSELAKRLESTPRLADIPGTLFLGGGAPVTVKDGGPIAGIGVAGAPSGDLDEKYAQAGAESLTK